MAKILRINLSTLTATTEEVPEAFRKFGGRGLTACILDREVPPTCDPLGVENKLIWAPGLMGGTTAPCSGRLSVGAKSPMTKGIKEANTGGAMGQKLARLGFKAVIFEGKAKEPTTVKIDKTGVSFCSGRSSCRSRMLCDYRKAEKRIRRTTPALVASGRPAIWVLRLHP